MRPVIGNFANEVIDYTICRENYHIPPIGITEVYFVIFWMESLFFASILKIHVYGV